jgi:Rps23 Pro-64 3,4-dihydroxylase Tpa1-like proline 4-hydroxylase
MINKKDWKKLHEEFISALPFNHIVIDNFLEEEVALKCVEEFPHYDDDIWTAHWLNAIENKKALNHWDKFKKTTYCVFTHLFSEEWIECMRELTGKKNIISDVGLHGGGLHAHTTGGNLNIHLDYSVHPKLDLQRNYNIILYMSPNWKQEWGGGLELWSHDYSTNKPKELVKTVDNVFNRAVIFDTTQYSWHGLPSNLLCPNGEMRRSFAVYYLSPKPEIVDPRGKALFVPRKEQENDSTVIELIEKRSNIASAESVWKT